MNAPKIGLAYSLAMILIGLAGYYLTGGRTALLGSAFGMAGAMCCGIALANERLRKHLMHLFVVLLLLIALPTSIRFFIAFQDPDKRTVALFLLTNAVLSWAVMGVMVKSFIDARRARKAAGG
ncbi:MAG: hypothetical protein SF028_09970 [Candidatus Sumerlaeia bacterium]|nr:hypothetical protein [Candidatus Sumerlaeia bacterium]